MIYNICLLGVYVALAARHATPGAGWQSDLPDLLKRIHKEVRSCEYDLRFHVHALRESYFTKDTPNTVTSEFVSSDHFWLIGNTFIFQYNLWITQFFIQLQLVFSGHKLCNYVLRISVQRDLVAEQAGNHKITGTRLIFVFAPLHLSLGIFFIYQLRCFLCFDQAYC